MEEVSPEKTNPLKSLTVTNDDLQFATLIYDAIIYWQDAFFGQMLLDSWENAERQFVPRVRITDNAQRYTLLGDVFTSKQVQELLQLAKSTASEQINRWMKSGYVERSGHGEYRKILKQIV